MKLYQHLFRGKADIPKMAELVHSNPAQQLHTIDLPYRFSSWAMDEPANISLWRDEAGELQAWVVMQSPFWTADIACRPDLDEAAYRQIVDWIDRRAMEILSSPYGRPAWFVPVFSELSERRAALEQAGFMDQGDKGEDSWSKVFMSMPLPASLPVKTLPPGFLLRPLAGEREVEAYVELHQAVFESKNMNVEWRLQTLQQPEYRPDLDLVIAAPDKRLAAFCIGWYDPSGPGDLPCAQVEPLGVHPDYRGLGLAQAILSEALRRFQVSGAQQAYVETDNYRDAAFQLYQSAGFKVIKDVLVYRKNFQK